MIYLDKNYERFNRGIKLLRVSQANLGVMKRCSSDSVFFDNTKEAGLGFLATWKLRSTYSSKIHGKVFIFQMV